MPTEAHRCIGGPLDGTSMQTHASKGVVVIRDEDHETWVYDLVSWENEGGALEDIFQARHVGKENLDSLDKASADPGRAIRVI